MYKYDLREKKVLNILQGYVLVYVIFVITSSSTVSWIHLIQSAVTVLTLKQPVTFYSTAQFYK